MLNITFHQATRDDVTAIYQLINQLAIYEHLEHEVIGTQEALEYYLFEDIKAHVVLVKEDGEAIGFALYFYTFSTFLCAPGMYLEDLFIKPGYRKQGIGFQLIQYLITICLETSLQRLEWSCLDWNVSSIDFYERKLGATNQKEWLKYRLTHQDMKRLMNT